jgi:hypothetical protein
MWWLASAPDAWAGVSAEGALRVGEPCAVTVTTPDGAPRAGVTVRVVWRPGLPGEHEEAAGLTDAEGSLTWTPEEPGAVRLRAGADTLDGVVAGPPDLATPLSLAAFFLFALALRWMERRRGSAPSTR